MKKKILLIVIIMLIVFLVYCIYINISFNQLVDNVINYKDKINYSTNIKLNIKTKKSSSNMEYDMTKSGSIKKIILIHKVDNELKYRIIRYKEKKNNEEVTYIYNDKSYEIAKNNKEIFDIRYEMLKNGKIIKVNKNKYIIKMKSYDAYNMIYPKNVVNQKATNKNIYVTILKDENNNFIKEIYYEIDDMGNNSMTYTVNIKNREINNQNKIELPF